MGDKQTTFIHFRIKSGYDAWLRRYCVPIDHLDGKLVYITAIDSDGYVHIKVEDSAVHTSLPFHKLEMVVLNDDGEVTGVIGPLAIGSAIIEEY